MPTSFSNEIEHAGRDIIAAAKAGEDSIAQYRIGALVGMVESNAAGYDVTWDQHCRYPNGRPSSAIEPEDIVRSLGISQRSRIWIDREGHRWRWCADAICSCWEREEAGGWLRNERSLTMSDYAPFTATSHQRLTGCTLCRRWNQPTEPIPGTAGDRRCLDRAACNHARYRTR